MEFWGSQIQSDSAYFLRETLNIGCDKPSILIVKYRYIWKITFITLPYSNKNFESILNEK